MKDKSELADIVARSHAVGLSSLFNFYARADYKNSKLIIAWLDQGGTELTRPRLLFPRGSRSPSRFVRSTSACREDVCAARLQRRESRPLPRRP